MNLMPTWRSWHLPGRKRFSKPEPPGKWTGVRDALKFGNECYQRPFPGYSPLKVGEKPVVQSENCLYLNIYKPADGQTDQTLAVMVWIHGGGFYIGAGSQYDGAELAATGVIVVTINYRLDIFGFLSNEDNLIPGNFGMLDQIMALKWIKGNIPCFGGDPNKITIFGESAGAASVSLLILSPLADKLFNRAIMSDGVSLSPWTIATTGKRITPRTTFSLVGAVAGCRDSDMDEKLQCLRQLDANVLFNASSTVQSAFGDTILFAPTVENAFSFLPDLPIILLMKNKFNHVDTIYGFNTDGFGNGIVGMENSFTSKNDFMKLFKQALEPYVLTEIDSLVNEVVSKYVGNNTSGNAIRDATVKALSDFIFTGSTVMEANIHSRLATKNKHYLYQFNYKPSFSSFPSWLHAVHGEDIPFVFGVNLPEFQASDKPPNKQDNLIWTQMKTYWSNFAKYGNPTETIPVGAVSWKPYDSRDTMYLKIDTKNEVLIFDQNKIETIYQTILQIAQKSYYSNSNVGRQ